MKLIHLKVAGFGPLRGEWSFAGDKLNLVVDDNERGKTSLLAAIAAALYGLEDDRRSHRVLTPLERWRPWNPGPYRVELEVDVVGRRLRITRDFDRGTVAVFDSGGREVTAEFLDGRDAYPVGQTLLGLDAAEFEKCAFVRQGDLDGVVPGDERARRASTLRARLENAADTHIGDTNASEALRVLEEALRRYNSPELEFTGTVDVAIDRLEAKGVVVDAGLHELDYQLAQVEGPLERLASLADEEQALNAELQSLDAERRAGVAAELRRQVEDDARQRADLARLEAEAAELESLAQLPPGAEADLRDTVARLEEAVRNLETLEVRRQEEISTERTAIEAELAALGPVADRSDDDANAYVTLAAELRRLASADVTARQQVFSLRDQLAAQGYEPERIQFLTARFSGLPEDQQRMLRTQSDANLQFQTEVARLEQDRTAASETLRSVDASRSGRRVPGWFALALGPGAAAAGGVAFMLHAAPLLWISLVAAGGVSVLLGVLLLMIGSRAQAVEREAALKRLGDAQRRLNQIRTQRADNEVALSDLARLMGYRDSVDLMRHWIEYSRMLEDSGPLLRAQEQVATYDQQRREAVDRVQPRLAPLGVVSPSPEALEKIAHDVRRAGLARTRLGELLRSEEHVRKDRALDEAAIAGLRERAVRILQAAGLTYDPERPWAEHIADLAQRASRRVRWAVLAEELIPFARQRLLPDADLEHRRAQLEAFESEHANSPLARTAVEIDQAAKDARLRLEGVQRERGDLRVQVEGVWRRHAQTRPELEAQGARIASELAQAREFKQAVEIARATIQKVAVDTHRRWADYLNARVGDVLTGFGTRIGQLRFGEDLDFSVQPEGGPTATRGKAHLQLSAGARDQLYLAVRLAVSEYLSRGGEPLPLLLDDVFATSDDQRLLAGMRALVEGYAGGHQVIAVTCHRGRHHELLRQMPELFRERVHWLDVGAASAVTSG